MESSGLAGGSHPGIRCARWRGEGRAGGVLGTEATARRLTSVRWRALNARAVRVLECRVSMFWLVRQGIARAMR